MDWSNLPPELLEEIYPKLASVVEFIRFRAVCRSWRSVAVPADLPSQLPWLLLPHDPSSDARPFLCLSTGTTHVLRLPGTRNKLICGSGHGWLILFDEDTTVVSLLNPLTGSLISLPPVDISAYYLINATLSANPTSAAGCVVAVRPRCTPTMAFCWVRPGGSTGWSKLQMKIKYWVTHTAYHHGCLFLTDALSIGSLYMWETTPKTLLVPADFTVEMPSPGKDWTPMHYQLVDSEEVLLLVGAYGRDGNPGPTHCSVAYRLDEETRQLVRVESQSIGDGVRSYDNDPLVTLSTGEYVACRERLYFARLGVADGDANADVIMKVLDLNNCGVEELRFESGYMPGFLKDVTWLVPSLI